MRYAEILKDVSWFYTHFLLRQALGKKLEHYHGSLSPEATIANITAVVQTGDVHLAVYDLTDNVSENYNCANSIWLLIPDVSLYCSNCMFPSCVLQTERESTTLTNVRLLNLTFLLCLMKLLPVFEGTGNNLFPILNTLMN